jgi:hypothetical protein
VAGEEIVLILAVRVQAYTSSNVEIGTFLGVFASIDYRL